jgi:integrase
MARPWAEKLTNGRWRGCYRDPRTQQKRYTTALPEHPYRLKSQAIAAATELLVKAQRTAGLSEGTLPASITWGDWWDLLAAGRPDKPTVTAYNEASFVRRHVRPYWGDTPLNRISRAAVVQWLETKLQVRPGMSAVYVHAIYQVFAHSIRTAVVDGVLDSNPLVRIPLPRRPRKTGKQHLVHDEVAAYAAHLDPGYAAALEFQVLTGLRPGELCGLHASRVDLEGGWLTVADVVVDKVSEPLLIRPYPKDSDERLVPLTPRAIELVRAALANRDLAAGCGVPHVDGQVCRSPLVWARRGRPMRPKTYYMALRRASQRSGLPIRPPYSARRGFATDAAQVLNTYAVMEIMGHTGMGMTAGYVQSQASARDLLTEAERRRGADAGAESPTTPPRPPTSQRDEKAG